MKRKKRKEIKSNFYCFAQFPSAPNTAENQLKFDVECRVRESRVKSSEERQHNNSDLRKVLESHQQLFSYFISSNSSFLIFPKKNFVQNHTTSHGHDGQTILGRSSAMNECECLEFNLSKTDDEIVQVSREEDENLFFSSFSSSHQLLHHRLDRGYISSSHPSSPLSVAPLASSYVVYSLF